ncbi:hypothetical protein CCM_08280 [Cordyceps militaris CM01]|uniref:Uncharacterized protein n=1 Tax=Cordyceps militaris (strain CM01) TaxID=983644 RepID=G3JT90_CORMM|nr:uncharacterized protein CCM_08280 [Cordyceps militaris CM01]EGX88237.1 hypothetical protein CCM_08280 [Cordyceps militaris CM01]
MDQPKQSADAPSPGLVAGRQFLEKILRPLTTFKSPGVAESVLEEYNATITPLDFASGQPVNNAPTLLCPMDRAVVRGAIDEIKPWMQLNEDGGFYNYEPVLEFFRYEPYYHYRNADHFANTVHTYLMLYQDEESPGYLLSRTSWDNGGAECVLPWLRYFHEDVYKWQLLDAFIHLLPYKPRPTPKPRLPSELHTPTPREPCPDPRKPHVICHTVDSTPWMAGVLRTSEFKTILFIAGANKFKPAFEASDHFAVTVLSFWNWEVRIVQGLVNFKTLALDIRVSSPQSFRDGIRNDDGSIDPRFLTLLGYNCGEVLPLST